MLAVSSIIEDCSSAKSLGLKTDLTLSGVVSQDTKSKIEISTIAILLSFTITLI
tara:strand:- start:3341 stop:3502 length:162 start_codon:yes stop_codon:yes gene_type:complete